MRRVAAHPRNLVAQLQARRLFNQRAAADIMRLASEQKEANIIRSSSIMRSRREQQQQQQQQQRVTRSLDSWRSKLYANLHTVGLRVSIVGDCSCGWPLSGS